jgi:hypothetical protein
MRILILAAALGACTTVAPYREPVDRTALWIHPTLEDARAFLAATEARLCIREVPDGFATEGC